MSPTIERLAPEAAETLETVRRGLADSNRVRLLAQGKDLAMMQPHDLCLAARGAGRALLGGLIGQVKWNWLYVDILWVGETSRGQGVGAALLARAEREALALGAVAGGAGGVEGFPCGGVAAKQGGGGDWGLEGRSPGRGIPHGFIIRKGEGHGPHDVPVFVPFRGAPPAGLKGPQLIFDVPRR